MGIAGYVSVCVQIYCMLVFAVFHYMFRPTWPSSSVYDSSYIYFHMLKDSASVRCLFFHVVTLSMFSICVLFLCCFLSCFFGGAFSACYY
jgi:hypothetical protein